MNFIRCWTVQTNFHPQETVAKKNKTMLMFCFLVWAAQVFEQMFLYLWWWTKHLITYLNCMICHLSRIVKLSVPGKDVILNGTNIFHLSGTFTKKRTLHVMAAAAPSHQHTCWIFIDFIDYSLDPLWKVWFLELLKNQTSSHDFVSGSILAADCVKGHVLPTVVLSPFDLVNPSIVTLTKSMLNCWTVLFI